MQRLLFIASTAALLAVVAALPISNVAHADDTAAIAFFESRIRPVLIEHCQECHSGDAEQLGGSLLVDSRAGLLTGGDSGAAVVPGKPEESLLLAALKHDGFEMPPAGRLPDQIVADFEQWIRDGAVDPREGPAPDRSAATIDIEAGRRHWAFQPIARPVPPAVSHSDWPTSDLDRFILACLEAQDLSPARDADRATWLRRVTFDLTGLPPTIAEIDAFLADTSSEAHATVVDRLLASPRFGERWARHWLDVARFAESSGGGRSLVFKEAWRYRDYVIDAFNADMPIDQFLTEQLAGDLLPSETPDDRARHLIATGYLMLGAINYEEQDKPFLEMNVIDEQLDTLGQGLLGMTLGCARCHDHKFDPVPTEDYYALAGILKSTKTLIHRNVSTWTEQQLPLPPAVADAVAAHQAAVDDLAHELQVARERLETLMPAATSKAPRSPESFAGVVIDEVDAVREGDWTLSTFTKPYIGEGYLHDADGDKGGRSLTFQPRLEQAGRYEVRLAYTPGPNRATNVPITVRSLEGGASVVVSMRKDPPIGGHFVSLGSFTFDTSNQWQVVISNAATDGHVIVDGLQLLPAEATADLAVSEPEVDAAELESAKAEVARLEKAKKELDQQRPDVPMAMAAEEAEVVGECHVCIRGDVHNTGALVERGVLQVATVGPPPTMPADASGRLQLAEWLADADHPLTSRVFINRIWQHLFGRGLVATPDNFGTTGSEPSHPALLDYLARRFTDGGWSTKRLIRELVLSRTYRQATTTAEPSEANPANRLLAGVNRRRLDAESLRDAILSIAGTLDDRMGGPGISDPSVLAKAGSETPSEYTFVFSDTRRSVYTPAFRNRRLELFEVFDAANPNAVVGRRPSSTVATQALYLLNSPFVMEQATAAAERLLAEPQDEDLRLERGFLRCLGRLPTAAEQAAAQTALASGGQSSDHDTTVAAWATLFQALFGSIDFRTLE